MCSPSARIWPSPALVFWYVGLIPDLATASLSKPGWQRRLLGFFSLGWDGSCRTWHRYELVYLLLAGLATPWSSPSTRSSVSISPRPSCRAGIRRCCLLFRRRCDLLGHGDGAHADAHRPKVMHLEDYITHRHIDPMCKLTLLTGSMVGLAYLVEFLRPLYSGNEYEQFGAAIGSGGRTAGAIG